MTSDEFYRIEIDKLEEQLKIMTNLVQHLRNKFINIADCIDQKGACMVDHIVGYIDEVIKPVN